jgi:hypothetical protein
LKARTGRKSKFIPGSTIVFIRNKRRDAFTFVREDGSIEELTFLEAAKEFEARIDEKSIPLHDLHHEHVKSALNVFAQQEEDAKAINQKVNFAQGPNEKKAIAYLDGFVSIPNITEQELELISKAKRAITTGKFQQLQRDINKLKTATKKTPIKPTILLEQLIKIIQAYPLEHISNGVVDKQVERLNLSNDFKPEIIISESFNL